MSRRRTVYVIAAAANAGACIAMFLHGDTAAGTVFLIASLAFTLSAQVEP